MCNDNKCENEFMVISHDLKQCFQLLNGEIVIIEYETPEQCDRFFSPLSADQVFKDSSFWADFMATLEYHLRTQSLLEISIQRRLHANGQLRNYYVSGKLKPISTLRWS